MAVEQFLIRYLRQWDGASHVETVMKLLSFLHPRSYDLLQGDVLRPLQRVVLLGSAEVVVRL